MRFFNYGAVSFVPLGTIRAIGREFERQAASRDYSRRMSWLIDTLKEEVGLIVGAQKRQIALAQSTCTGIGSILNSLDAKTIRSVGLFEDEYINVDIVVRGWCQKHGKDIITLPRNPDTWPSHPHYDVLVISHVCHLDGTAVDVDTIATRFPDTIIILDCAQSVGNIEAHFKTKRNLFLVFPCYKWLMGPAAVAFIVAPHNLPSLGVMPSTPSCRGLELKDYLHDRRLAYRPDAAVYETTAISAQLLSGALRQVRAVRRTFAQKAEKATIHAALFAGLLESVAGVECRNHMVTFPIAREGESIHEALTARGIICSMFRSRGKLRFCFSGLENPTKVREAASNVLEILAKNVLSRSR